MLRSLKSKKGEVTVKGKNHKLYADLLVLLTALQLENDFTEAELALCVRDSSMAAISWRVANDRD